MNPSTTLCLLLAVSATAADARNAHIDGSYRSPTTSLDMIVLDGTKGVIAASTVVAMPGCSGSVAGIGTVAGDELKFSPYVKAAPDDACVITVRFDKRRRMATIRGEGCMNHSGAACGWEGDTVKRVER